MALEQTPLPMDDPRSQAWYQVWHSQMQETRGIFYNKLGAIHPNWPMDSKLRFIQDAVGRSFSYAAIDPLADRFINDRSYPFQERKLMKRRSPQSVYSHYQPWFNALTKVCDETEGILNAYRFGVPLGLPADSDKLKQAVESEGLPITLYRHIKSIADHSPDLFGSTYLYPKSPINLNFEHAVDALQLIFNDQLQEEPYDDIGQEAQFEGEVYRFLGQLSRMFKLEWSVDQDK